MGLAEKFPITDVRGRGLMVAVEFGGLDGSLTAQPGIASTVTKAAGKRNMLLLSAGKAVSFSHALDSLNHIHQPTSLDSDTH